MATRDASNKKNIHPPNLAFLKIAIVLVLSYFENHLSQINHSMYLFISTEVVLHKYLLNEDVNQQCFVTY